MIHVCIHPFRTQRREYESFHFATDVSNRRQKSTFVQDTGTNEDNGACALVLLSCLNIGTAELMMEL